MKYLGTEIILDTMSIDIAVLIFSLISLFCSIITILIYFKIKSLRTIIYRIFFHVAINETISRIVHIINFFNNESLMGSQVAILFDITTFLIIITDTNILLYIAFACYAMYELILKQNKRINNQFSIFFKVSLVFSAVMTAIVFSLTFTTDSFNRRIDLYRNVIALNFIKDKDIGGNKILPLLISTIVYFLLVMYSLYKTILIQIFIRRKGDLGDGDEEGNEDKRMQKSLKLKSFKNKMMQYPLLGLYFIVPLIVYSYIEYFKKIESENEDGDLNYLKARFIFYNILCFMNSTRGLMFFRVFISNEKIKMYLFKKYLTSSVFYTIDKIKPRRERSFTKSSANSMVLNTTITALFDDDSFEYKSSKNKKLPEIVNKKDINEKDKDKDNEDNIDDDSKNNEEDKLLVELNDKDKDKSFEFNINNIDEDNEIDPRISNDSKSENLKVKGHL